MRLTEIERIPGSDYPGNEFEDDEMSKARRLLQNAKPVLGHKGYFWTMSSFYGNKSIVILNPNHTYPKNWYNDKGPISKPGPAIIAQLRLDPKFRIPNVNMYQINTVSVRKEYRGQGLGTALYLIAMRQLKLWLMAGSSQTPGSRQTWIRLNTIPGIEVDGLLMIPKEELANPVTKYQRYGDVSILRSFDRLIEELMKIGFNHFADSSEYSFFLFPVKKGKGELINAVRKAKFQIYTGWQGHNGKWDEDVSLVARWVG